MFLLKNLFRYLFKKQILEYIMKKRILSVFIVLTLLIGVGLIFAQEFSTLAGYYNSLNASCKTDDDCVIKNIENCCGYYPKCLSKEAVLNPEEVERLCEGENATGCPIASLGYCRCQGESSSRKKCVGHVGASIFECGDGDCFREETNESSGHYCPSDCSAVPIKQEEPEINDTNETVEETEESEENETEVTPIDEDEEEAETQNAQTEDTKGNKLLYILLVIFAVILIVGLFFILKKRRKKLSVPWKEEVQLKKTL